MRVYLAYWELEYHSTEIIGVFSTYLGAREAIENLNHDSHWSAIVAIEMDNIIDHPLEEPEDLL